MKRSAELMAVANSLAAHTPSPTTPAAGKDPIASGSAEAHTEMVSGRMLVEGLVFGCQLPTAVRLTVAAHERSEIHAVTHNASGGMVLTGPYTLKLKP